MISGVGISIYLIFPFPLLHHHLHFLGSFDFDLLLRCFLHTQCDGTFRCQYYRAERERQFIHRVASFKDAFNIPKFQSTEYSFEDVKCYYNYEDPFLPRKNMNLEYRLCGALVDRTFSLLTDAALM